MLSLNRRQFLQVSGGLLVALGWSGPGPAPRVLAAGAPLPRPGIPDRILVVLELLGGNDGLNTVVPYASGRYYDLRPQLAIAQPEVLPLNGQVGLHPSLTGLQQLFQQGRLAILQGVGYPNPNRSHFRSMEIWQTGDPVGPPRSGWLGRWLDRYQAGDPNPLKAVGVGGAPSRALLGRTGVPAVESVAQFRVEASRAPGARAALLAALGRLYDPEAGGSPALALVRGRGRTAMAAAAALEAAGPGYQPGVAYPNTLAGRRLQTVAQLIAAGVGTRVLYTSVGGFDDHANEKGQHGRLLAEVDGAVSAFWADLTARGLAGRVVLLAWSEFGRRARENASGGTDHGAAGPVFLLGGKVRGGLVGEHPRLEDLNDGDLRFGIDYRSVYQELLEDWLGGDGAEVLGARFDRLGLLQRG